jgi:ABC-type glycerol-3-phosphate transport system substrate-binding protein
MLLGILTCVLGIVSVSVLGDFSQVPDPEEANINWRQFEGETIMLILNRHPWQESIEPLIPEFESLTGISVEVHAYPEATGYYTKLRTGLAAGSLKEDVLMTSPYDGPNYIDKGWIADLQPYYDNSQLTDKEWFDWEGFYESAKEGCTRGYFNQIPIIGDCQVLIYRKDIFEQLGIEVPETLKEVENVAKTIREETPYYGATMRGGQYLFWPLGGYIWSFGGTFFDEEFNPTLDSPETIAAVQLYVDTLKYSPPGSVNYDWDEINTALLSGAAAMFLDSSVMWPRVLNPELSVVAGKVGVAPFPSGPVKRAGNTDFWSIGISNFSEKKEAAWLFLQWATCEATQMELAKKGIYPPRGSLAESSFLVEALGEDYVNAVSTSLENAGAFKVSTGFWEWMNVVTTAVQKAVLGTPVEEALNTGQQELERLVAEWREEE